MHTALGKKEVENTLPALGRARFGWLPAFSYGKQAEAAGLNFLGKHLRKR